MAKWSQEPEDEFVLNIRQEFPVPVFLPPHRTAELFGNVSRVWKYLEGSGRVPRLQDFPVLGRNSSVEFNPATKIPAKKWRAQGYLGCI